MPRDRNAIDSGPIREGNRGGAGLFKWTDVVQDKDRENYLGHSLYAPVGRWQKNKDITWYNKDKSEDDVRNEELRRIKRAEEDALSLALGYKPTLREPTPPIEDSEANLVAKMEEKAQRKALKRIEKEERRAAKEVRRAEKEARRAARAHHQDSRARSLSRSRSRSGSRSRSRSPDRRRRDSSSPPPRRRRRDYDSDDRTDDRSRRDHYDSRDSRRDRESHYRSNDRR